MGRINYTIPDENTEERLEILEGIAEDINLMIADTKLAMVYKSHHTKEDERGNNYDDDDDWFYSDDDEENY